MTGFEDLPEYISQLMYELTPEQEANLPVSAISQNGEHMIEMQELIDYLCVELSISFFKFDDKIEDIYGCIGNVNNSRLIKLYLDDIESLGVSAFNNTLFCLHYRTFLRDKIMIADLDTELMMEHKEDAMKELLRYTKLRNHKKDMIEEMKYHPRYMARMMDDFGELVFEQYAC
jgi:hypothetical protein